MFDYIKGVFHNYKLRLLIWRDFVRYNNRVGKNFYQEDTDRILAAIDVIRPEIFENKKYLDRTFIIDDLSVINDTLASFTEFLWSILVTVNSGEIIKFKTDRSIKHDVKFRNYLIINDGYIVSPVKQVEQLKLAAKEIIDTKKQLVERKDIMDNRNISMLSLVIEEIDYLVNELILFQIE